MNRMFAKYFGQSFVRYFISGGAMFLAAACSTLSDIRPAAAPQQAAAPSTPIYVLSDILGAPPASIDALLGAPSLTRREGDGEYRRYGLSTCTLIIILYPNDAGAVRAAHVDTAAQNASQEKPDLNACLAAG